MKKPNAAALALLSAAALAAFVATTPMPSSAAPAATESFVTNRIAQAIGAANAYTDAAVSNKADAVRVSADGQVVVSCSWWDGWHVLTWNGSTWSWASGLPGGRKELDYNDGWWEYSPTVGPNVYTNSVPIYGLPASLTLYDDDGTVTLVRTNEVYAAVTNTYPVAYMDDVSRATNALRQTVFEKIAEEAENYAPAGLTNSVNTLWTYVYGESVWIAVTNYLRTVAGVFPSFELWEVRDGSTNRVYSSREEITNLAHKAVADCQTACQSNINNAVSNPVNRAWSRYDSVTGEEAPEGLTIIGTPAIQLSGGGTWQRYVSTGGSTFWTLQSNGLNPIFGGDTNGFFRVLDNEGNPTFEVRKTDAYLVPATPSGTGWSGERNFCVSFASADGTRPDLYVATNLAASAFIPIGDDPNITEVGWTQTGASGAYTNTAEIVQAVAQPVLFLYGEVTVEGETAIVNSAPTRFDGGIIMGGVKYTLGTTTVNGKTVLTLETN